MRPKISIFTKPWKTLQSDALCMLVKDLGFDGIELPVRPGCQVEPEHVADGLLEFAELAKTYELTLMSVAAKATEQVFAACSKAGVPLIRIMLSSDLEEGYMASEDVWVEELRAADLLCAKYGVKLGVQPHYGAGISSTMELRHLLERANCAHVGAIWDAAHSALAGEVPEQALDIIWDFLLLVNLKNAYYKKEETGAFRPYFTTGNDGAADWSAILRYLKKRGYAGDLCMPAEYNDEKKEVELITQDIAYVKALLNG